MVVTIPNERNQLWWDQIHENIPHNHLNWFVKANKKAFQVKASWQLETRQHPINVSKSDLGGKMRRILEQIGSCRDNQLWAGIALFNLHLSTNVLVWAQILRSVLEELLLRVTRLNKLPKQAMVGRIAQWIAFSLQTQQPRVLFQRNFREMFPRKNDEKLSMLLD